MSSALTDRQWLWLAGEFYLAAFLFGTFVLLRGGRLTRTITYALTAIGYACQLTGLYLRGLAVGGCPLGNLFEIFQFTAWSATSLYLVIGVTFRLSLLGYFTACLSAVLTLVSLAIPAWDATRREDIFGGNAWIEFHAALALFSYGVFALLALTSVLYVLRNYSLKSKHIGGYFAFLPSILDLDHISVRLLTAGVVLMTASLAVGTAWWVRDLSSVDLPKLSLTAAVWIAYAVALALRLRGILLAKRFAIVGLVLFGVALFSLWVVDASRNPAPQSPAALAQP